MPSNKSDTARFSKNKFVIVLIRRLCIKVNITKIFPITARKKMIAYKKIVIQVPDSLHGEKFEFALFCTAFEIFCRIEALKIFFGVEVSFSII
jgi:hypothetical protein